MLPGILPPHAGSLHTADQAALRALHTCLLSWITEPNKPLSLPDILHDIFLKTGNSRGGISALLNRNLTDQASFTTRYPDPQTTSILFNSVLVC